MKKIILFAISLALITSCAKESVQTRKPNSVPESWYNGNQTPRTSEGETTSESARDDDDGFGDPRRLEQLGETIDTILAANSEALEAGDAEALNLLSPMMLTSPDSKNDKPKDWVPWRAEYFMTDLSITASGLVGVLTLKGTATTRAFWRKQGPAEKKLNPEMEIAREQDEVAQGPVVQVNEDTSASEMVKQLEPAIHAAVSTGKIKDTPDLRKNLMKAAQEFQSIASAIPATDENLPWWVSRFRLDFTIDAVGRVEPVGMVGGEARFRFEWHRIRRKANPQQPSLLALSDRSSRIRKSLKDFVTATATDLDAAFASHKDVGFKAHQMRMGLGVSVKGDIGAVKGTAGLVGQIYFTRNVDRPKVRPPAQLLAMEEEAPILLIEKNPTRENLLFAAQNHIQVESYSSKDSGLFDEVVYKMDRKVFRKGLFKAAKIGKFFADRASKAQFRNWKIYELRTAFDASISAGLNVVTIAGTGTAQISFFNQNF